MKRYRGSDGLRRLWFELDEIESMMENELQRAELLPTGDNPVVNVEAFIERHLCAHLDHYAELEAAVLALTEFRSGMSPKVLVNRDLTGAAIDEGESAPGILGRWRATLAHEASHVLMHQILFEGDENQGHLFEAASNTEVPRLMRCLKKNVLYRDGGSDWREVQANRGMAALLMPQSVFVAVARDRMQSQRRGLERIDQDSDEARALTTTMASAFAVSRQAASIRLRTLGVVSRAGQRSLPES